MAKTDTTNTKKLNFSLNNIFCIIMAIYLFIAPFPQGLFNKQVFYPFLIVLFIFTAVYINLTKSVYIDKMLFLVYGLQIIISLITVFTGINKQEAVYGFFRSVSFLMLIFLFTNILSDSRDDKGKNNVLCQKTNIIFSFIFASGVITAIINLILGGNKTGLNEGELLRLNYVIGYANTLAVFMFITIVLGLYLVHVMDLKGWKSAFAKYGIFLCMVCFVLTYSRIMWVLSFAACMVFVFITRRFRLGINLIGIGSLALICSAIISSTDWNVVWIPVIASLAIIWVSTKVNLRFNKVRDRKGIIIAATSCIVGVVALGGFFAAKSEGLYQRLTSINLQSSELIERFVYYSDSLRILRDNLFIGTGVGGWNSIQYKYQSALYATKYVHSSIVQAALDFGIAGLILYIAQVLILLIYAYKALKISESKGLVQIASLVAGVMILHSLLDVDFEFQYIMMLLILFASILSHASGNAVEIERKHPLILKVAVNSTVVMLLIPLFLLSLSWNCFLTGNSEYAGGKFSEAQGSYEKAQKLNPWLSDAYYMHGQLLSDQYDAMKNPELIEKSAEKYDMAIKYDPMSPKYPSAKAVAYRKISDVKKYTDEYERLVLLQPMVIEHYEDLVEGLVKMGEEGYKAGLKDEAITRFKKVVEIVEGIRSNELKVNELAKRLKNKPNMSLTNKLYYNIGISMYYLGKYDEAQINFDKAALNPTYKVLIEKYKN